MTKISPKRPTPWASPRFTYSMTAQRRVAVSPSVAAGQENGDQLREVGEILRGKRRSRSPPAPARRVVYDRGTLLWKADPLEWKNCCTIDECAAPDVVGHYPRARKCIADAGGNSAMIKEIAWRSLVEEVMDHDIAGRDISSIVDLKAYLAKWKGQSGTLHEVENVDKLIRWTLHSKKELCNICRIGSWLGDAVHSEVVVRECGFRPSIQYKAIGNGPYKQLSMALNLADAEKSSNNNCGNILEHMMWLALENKRYEWILGVVRWCAKTEFPEAASSHRSASSSASGHAAAPQMRSQVDSKNGSCRKAARSGADNDAAPQASNKRLRTDVQATQASSSASSHAAAPQETNKNARMVLSAFFIWGGGGGGKGWVKRHFWRNWARTPTSPFYI